MAWFPWFPWFAWFDRPFTRGAKLLLAAGISLGTGCSLLFNPDNLGNPESEPDASLPIDVMKLELTSINPAIIDEGTGTLRRVPVVLTGNNIAPNALVRLSGAGFASNEMQPLAVSSGGTMAAFTIAIPVLPDLDDGVPGTVQVEVFQADSAVTASLPLQVNGLDDLVASEYGPQNDDTLDTDSTLVKPKYARIILDANLRATGSQPLRLTATSEIVLDAQLDASGQTPAAGVAGVAGAGGCSGGPRDSDGACLPAGGGRGDRRGGGGGGGHASSGTSGSTASDGGAGGVASGHPTLVPLGSERGGGGGGGGSDRGDGGGGGGGGGGIIELVSLGAFRVESGARLLVQGGAGEPCRDTDTGGGGGGAGGAILLRAPAEIEDTVQSDILLLDGGQGGTGTGCTPGGAGAAGRARVDAPTMPLFARGDQPFHGAVLSLETPVIVRDSQLPVRIRGAATTRYLLAGGVGTEPEVTLDATGQGTVTLTLAAGINRVCAVVPSPVEGHVDGENCLSVAYVPE